MRDQVRVPYDIDVGGLIIEGMLTATGGRIESFELPDGTEVEAPFDRTFLAPYLPVDSELLLKELIYRHLTRSTRLRNLIAEHRDELAWTGGSI